MIRISCRRSAGGTVRLSQTGSCIQTPFLLRQRPTHCSLKPLPTLSVSSIASIKMATPNAFTTSSTNWVLVLTREHETGISATKEPALPFAIQLFALICQAGNPFLIAVEKMTHNMVLHVVVKTTLRSFWVKKNIRTQQKKKKEKSAESL